MQLWGEKQALSFDLESALSLQPSWLSWKACEHLKRSNQHDTKSCRYSLFRPFRAAFGTLGRLDGMRCTEACRSPCVRATGRAAPFLTTTARGGQRTPPNRPSSVTPSRSPFESSVAPNSPYPGTRGKDGQPRSPPLCARLTACGLCGLGEPLRRWKGRGGAPVGSTRGPGRGGAARCRGGRQG